MQHALQKRGEKLQTNYLRTLWEQMLDAVHTIHEEKIIHSDLKPANFVIVQGQLKLIDFGIAKAIQSDTTNIVRESGVSKSLPEHIFFPIFNIQDSLSFV